MRAASGSELIERERRRQTDAEGWSHRHDAGHTHDELALAAACYAIVDRCREYNRGDIVPIDWPWENEAWKPTPEDRVRELVKAGALIAAEIDRLLRAG